MRCRSRVAGLWGLALTILCTVACRERPHNDPAGITARTLVPNQGAGPTYSIGGTVNNSVASSWVKLRLGDAVLKVTGTNQFTFPNQYLTGTHYAVTLDDNAPATGCGIANGIGVLGTTRVSNIVVTCNAPTTASGFALSGFPGNILAGAGGNITVTVNAGGATSIDYRGFVKFTSSDPNAVLPAPYQFTANDSGVHTFSAVLDTAGLQAIFINDEQAGLSVSQSNVNVGARAIFYLDLGAFPSPVTAGQQGNVTVTARDQYGNVAVSYTGTAQFTSSDANAVLPANYDFMLGNAGVAYVPVTLTTAGVQAINANDITHGALPGSQTGILVNPNVAYRIVATQFPSPVTAGQFATVHVVLYDRYGNIVTNYLGTVQLSSSDPNAALPPAYTFDAADAGAHDFTAALTTAGIRSITASDANAPGVSGQEGNILVNPNVAVAMRIYGFPTTVTAGQQANVTVTAYDAYANVATGFAGTVVLSTLCPNAVITPNSVTFVPATNAGNVTVPIVFTHAGICSIDGNASSPPMVASEGNILVNPNVVVTLWVRSFPNPTTAGVQGNVTISAMDAYGNVATGFTDTVTLSSSDPNVALPSNRAFLPGDMGQAMMPVTLDTAGLQWLNANDVGTPSIAGQQPNILVNPGPTKLLAVSGYPNPATAGQQGNVTIVAFDNFNNLTPAYTGTVRLDVSDPNATYPFSVTFASGNHGVNTASVTMTTSGTWHIDANDVGTPSIAGEQNSILVNPNVAAIFAVNNYPSPVTAGTQANVTLTAYDAYANVAVSYTGSVGLHVGDPNAQTVTTYGFTAPNAGTISLPVTYKSSGTWYIDVNDLVTPSIAGQQNNIIVNPGNANRLRLTGFSSPIVAGTPNNFTVTAYDVYGNIATGYTGDVTFTSTDPIASLPADYAFGGVGIDNGNHTFTATLKAAGNQNIIVTDTLFASLTASQNNIVVGPSNANYLEVKSFPSPIAAGTAANVTVVAHDIYGNIATGYTGTVVTTSTDPNALAPANKVYTGPMAGAGNITLTLITAGLRNINANDLTTPAIAGRQLSILVTTGSPNYLKVSAYPNLVTAGSANTVTVAAYDIYNNLVTQFADTVTFSSSDPNASLPGATAYGSLDAGTKNFSATFFTSGNQNIVVIDANVPAVKGVEPNIVVSPAVPSRFQVAGYPTVATAGQQANITITAYDAYNNVATNYVNEVRVISSDSNAVINPNDFNFLVSNAGVAQVSVALTTVGTRYIQVNDANNFSITGQEPNIVVSPNVATHLGLSNYPSPVAAGSQGNLVVTAYDAYNNIATGYTGTVHFTSTDANAALSPNITFVAGNHGVRLASITLQSSGTQSITGNDTVSPSIAGLASILVVNPSSVVTFGVLGFPNPATVGQQGNITVTAYDSYHNVVTGYTGTVQISSTDTNAILPPNRVYSASDVGVVTLPVTLRTSGNITISANDTVSPSIAGNQNSIVVNPNTAVRLKATGFPTTINAGQAANIIITAYDIYGNVAKGYTGTVRIYASDANASLPANYTFGGTNGNVALPVTLKTTGLWSISGNDTVTASLNSVQRNITVNANNANHLTLVGYPASSIAGQTSSVTVTAYDDFNNIATGYRGTVHFTSSDANAAKPIDYTFAATDNGSASMAVTLKSAGSWYINANDTVTTTLNSTQPNRVVSPNVAVNLAVTGFPVAVTAGQAANVIVTAYDAYGNLATTTLDTIKLSSSDPNAKLPANAALSSSGNVIFYSLVLKTVGTRIINANDTSNTSVYGSETGIVVSPNSPNYLLASSFPSPVNAGQQGNIHIVAYDLYGNLVPSYAGTVVTTSTDPNAVLPSNYTFTGGNAGAANILVTLVNVGYRNITVTDNANAFLTANQNNILVNPNAPVRTYFSVSPNDSNVCTLFSATVQLRDNYNNTCTNSNLPVTLNWLNNPNSAWLSGTTTVSAVAGVARFTRLAVNFPGRNLSLSANATGVAAGVSGDFNIFAAAPQITNISAPINSNTAVAIAYGVADACAANANVNIEVWTTPVGNWNHALAAVGTPYGNLQVPTASNFSGKSLTYWWDSSRVLRGALDTNVWVRITPTSRNLTGTTLTYGPFTVDNRMTFVPTYARAYAAAVASCSMVDINLDGAIDVVNALGSSNKFNFNINNGSGNFDTEYTNTATAAYVVTTGDLNRDGRVDVVVAPNTLADVNVVFFNKTTATGAVTQFAMGRITPAALGVADFNGDGYLDIVAASATDNNITVARGAASGTFATSTVKTLPVAPTAMDIGDVDRNGYPDIVVTSNAGSAIYVLTNDQAGYFASLKLSTGMAPTVSRIADINHDGNLDIITLNGTAASIQVRPGDGNGLFFTTYAIGTISGGVDLQVTDLDNDGNLDIAVLTSANLIAVHRNYGNITFGAYTTINGAGTYSGTTAGTSHMMCVGDVNHDGRMDLYVAADQVAWTAINTTPRSTTVRLTGQPIYMSGGSEAGGVAVADVNMDGIADLVISDPTNSQISLLTGTGPGAMNANVNIVVTGYPRVIVPTELNHDKVPDFVAASDTTNYVLVFTGTGTTGLTQRTSLPVGGLPKVVAVGDLNHDGHTDVVASVQNANLIWRFLGNGDGTFGTGVSYSIGNGPNGLVLADFDHDGNLDVATMNYSDGKVARMLGTGTGAFTSLASYATSATASKLAVGDRNGDGYLDLYTVTSTPSINIFTNNGSGGFGAYAIPTGAAITSSELLAVGDLNQDGISDVAAYNSTTSEAMSIFYMNASSTATSYEQRGINGYNQQATYFNASMADIDGDGWLDILVPDGSVAGAGVTGQTGNYANTTNLGTVTAAFNSGVGVTVPNPTAATIVSGTVYMSPTLPPGAGQLYTSGAGTSYPFDTPDTIAIGDLDRDGKADIAGSYRNNSAFVGVRLWQGLGTGVFNPNIDAGPFDPGGDAGYGIPLILADLDHDGWTDLIGCGRNFDWYYNLNSRAGTINGFQGFVQNASTGAFYYGQFTDISVGDLNRDGTLDLTLIEVNKGAEVTLNSGSLPTFTNGGNQTLVAATNWESCLGDANGDGILDTGIVHAQYGVYVGLGNGSGGWSTAPALVAGTAASSAGPGGQRCTFTDVDLDGDLDLVVSSCTQYGNGISYWLTNNGAGSFSTINSLSVALDASAHVVADFNTDGFVDIATVTSSANAVLVYLGKAGGAYQKPQLYFHAGSYHNNSIATGDLNNDGRPDLAAGSPYTFMRVFLNP